MGFKKGHAVPLKWRLAISERMIKNNPMKSQLISKKMVHSKSKNPMNRLRASLLMKRLRKSELFNQNRMRAWKANGASLSVSQKMKANNPMKSPETVEKFQMSQKKFQDSGGSFGRMWADPHKRSRALKTILEKRSTKEYRESRSEWLSNRILEGKHLNSYGRRGYFYSEKNKRRLFYRSMLERDAYIILEGDYLVSSYDVEAVKIPYLFEGVKKYYIPDIRAVYSDSSVGLIEVKPFYKLKIEFELAKLAVLKNYCLFNNLKSHVWTEREIYAK